MTVDLDPRVHPYRKDLAASYLQDKIHAERYAEGELFTVRRGHVPLTAHPDAAAPLMTELLYGELFTCYDIHKGWAWGQNMTDGHVGYTPLDGLSVGHKKATHKIGALGAFVYERPEFKAKPLDCLPFESLCSVTDYADKWVSLEGGGWVYSPLLSSLDSIESDVVSTARRFLRAPYLWGGRTPHGIDCSGLVQISLRAAGITTPRDSDMQAKSVGEKISAPAGEHTYAPQDLVFFPSHVGMMATASMLIHANAAAMMVTEDPVEDVIQRWGPVTTVRRLKIPR